MIILMLYRLGYDVRQLGYLPGCGLLCKSNLPLVLVPGTPVGVTLRKCRSLWVCGAGCPVCAGTTDSITAFASGGALIPGQAASLGRLPWYAGTRGAAPVWDLIGTIG